VTERSAAKWRNDGDGADIIGAPFRAGHCTAHSAARPDRTPPDGAQAEEEADGVTDRAGEFCEPSTGWRDVCRWGL